MRSTPRLFRCYGAALLVAALGAAALLARFGRGPSLVALALFAGLTIYSEHHGVDVGNTIMSPGWMIVMAGIVAFDHEHAPLGALLVGLCAGIYLPQLRRREFGVLAVNAGVLGLATLAAAGALSLFPDAAKSHFPLALALSLVPTVAYVIGLWVLLGIGYALRTGASARAILADFVPTTAQYVSFSLVGFLLGTLYVALGPGVLVLVIVPILIAREMFASYMRVKEAHEETVQMLIRALEQKDRYTAGHAERVANYARYIGEELSFMPARLERLQFAALMHDIGKLVVPNHILNKPGRLTPEEFEQIRMHEKVGVQMLSHIDFLRPIAPTTHGDNMRFDPDDLDHPIEPYIVMIADAYDAMTSTRAYRKALPQEVAFQELRDKAGIQFHPQCVEALIHAIETKGEKHGAGFEEPSEFVDAPDTGLGSAGLGDLLPSEAP